MAIVSRKGDAPAVGYPEWDGSRDGRDHQQPETGRWDLRQERWIPQQRGPEGDDFGIGPFPARSNGGRPGEGRILDHDDYRAGERRHGDDRTGEHRRLDGHRTGERRALENYRTGEHRTGRTDRTGERRALESYRTGEHRTDRTGERRINRADRADRTGEWSTGHHRRYEREHPAPAREDEDDEEEYDERTNYIGSFFATAGWYLVPILGYAGWAMTLSSDPRPGCVTEFGLPCPAPRTEVLTNLLDHGPQLAVSLALSISVAMFLGWATSGWRPTAIGFASAVLGAGVATVLFAVLATQF